MDIKKVVAVAAILLASSAAFAKGPTYDKVLKRWTRHGQVYAWDNFEARLIWNATYLSDEFRASQRQKLAELYEWSDADLQKRIREDDQEARRFDTFILSIYAGSSEWPEVGKDDGKWGAVLENDRGTAVESEKFERIPVTQAERMLYPYLDKWSQLYRVSFPKTHGEHLRLRLTGMPARSELVWMSRP